MPTLPQRHRVVRVIVFVGLFWAVGLAVFLSYMLALTYSQGGQLTLNMTLFGEDTLEYWLMMVVVPVVTLAMFYTIELLPTGDEQQ